MYQQQCLDAVEANFNEKFLDDLIKAQEQLARAGTPAGRNALKQTASRSGTGVLKTIPGSLPSTSVLQSTENSLKNLATAEAQFAKELSRAANLPPISQRQLLEDVSSISDVCIRAGPHAARSAASNKQAQTITITRSGAQPSRQAPGFDERRRILLIQPRQNVTDRVCVGHKQRWLRIRSFMNERFLPRTPTMATLCLGRS